MVRGIMDHVARALNHMSGGHLHPNVVTIIGLIMHLPIAWFIAFGDNYIAAGLLIVFGLFDTLDGSLARLQNRASNTGMLLDATTDRFKEVILYSGVGYALASTDTPTLSMWAVIACGASLSVSYVKAKGELAVKDTSLTANQINRLFQDGLLRFEVRMAILVIGLITHELLGATVIVACLSVYTALTRLVSISTRLRERPTK